MNQTKTIDFGDISYKASYKKGELLYVDVKIHTKGAKEGRITAEGVMELVDWFQREVIYPVRSLPPKFEGQAQAAIVSEEPKATTNKNIVPLEDRKASDLGVETFDLSSKLGGGQKVKFKVGGKK